MFAEDVVAEAFDLAIHALSQGRRIRDLGAWLYKVVDRLAGRRLDQARLLRDDSAAVASALNRGSASDEEIAEQEQREAEILEQALAHATDLAPHVETGQVREVFDLFIEAVRNEVVDGVPELIAETLAIPVPQVRTLIHRALTRLRGEAAKRGIALPPVADPANHNPHQPEDSND